MTEDTAASNWQVYLGVLIKKWFLDAEDNIDSIPYDFKRELCQETDSNYAEGKAFTKLETQNSRNKYADEAIHFVLYLLKVSELGCNYHGLSPSALECIKEFKVGLVRHWGMSLDSGIQDIRVNEGHLQLLTDVFESVFLVKYSLLQHRRDCPVWRYWMFTGLNPDGGYKTPMNMTHVIARLKYLIRLYVVYMFGINDVQFKATYLGDATERYVTNTHV
jgi:hypothetical protein